MGGKALPVISPGPQAFMDKALRSAIAAGTGAVRPPIATPATASADQAAATTAASRARKRAVGTVLGRTY